MTEGYEKVNKKDLLLLVRKSVGCDFCDNIKHISASWNDDQLIEWLDKEGWGYNRVLDILRCYECMPKSEKRS